MTVRMQQRRGTAEQWTLANPVLAEGEIGFETDTNQFKIGNGVGTWSTLEYFGGNVSWSEITNKPIAFTPEPHNHLKADITDFAHSHTKSDISDFVHTHTMSEITDYVEPVGTVLSDTAPSTPVAGTRWIKTTTWQEYIYFDSSWVEI